MKKKAVFLSMANNRNIGNVYNERTQSRLREKLDLSPEMINPENMEQHKEMLAEVEVAFATWGIPKLTEEQIEQYFPKLTILLYGAGSVQHFARPFLAKGVTIVSAWAANAVPVAEFTVATIILANKGFVQTANRYKQVSHKASREHTEMYKGNYGATVGILGAGMIGRRVIEMLQSYRLILKVYDPFLPDAKAVEMGVHKTDLIDIFSNCDTISNHLANLPETQGILNKDHFDKMLPHATFINTGRGAQVVEADLIQALKDVPTRTALLDVTYPEPVEVDSELLKLDNVVLTPHIAGSFGQEVARMGVYMEEEYERFTKGEPLRYQVTLEMLATMA
ncbi:hydroxyacid dehydrogenase [Paenibacillus koleovorans]|uniref:hydroxyacid dehydrogenase n=1 Tax=Paenibacillus koleovorans TaxID=121608 RepID=UPI000FDA1D9D|nr:hydroxyacid dehydrogenase [Paenibacillus koleovorans]